MCRQAADPGRAGTRVAITSVAVALLALGLCGPGWGPWCTLAPDSLSYLDSARSLIESGRFPPHRIVRPPGFPLLIAPLLALGDAPFLALRILFSFCWAATSAMTYLLHRRELGDRPALVAAVLVALSPTLFLQTTVVLSEPVFITVTMGALLLMSRWRRRPAGTGTEAALGGLLAAAAVMVRTMGVVLVPLMAGCLLRHRRQRVRQRLWRGGLFTLCVLGPCWAWHVRQSHYPPNQGYLHIWTTALASEHSRQTGAALLLERLTRFGPRHLRSVKAAMVPQGIGWRLFAKPLDTPSTFLVGGFVFLVAVSRMLRYRATVDAYVVVTLPVLCVWPWDEGERLVSPLIPLFAGYVVWAGVMLGRRTAGHRRRRLVLGSAAVVLIGVQAAEMCVTQSRSVARRDRAVQRFARMDRLARWQVTNVPQAASCIGVAPDGHNAKTVLLGAAYLSRHPIETIDVRREYPSDPVHTRQTWGFVHESLAGDIAAKWGRRPMDHVDEFVVFAPGRAGR